MFPQGLHWLEGLLRISYNQLRKFMFKILLEHDLKILIFAKGENTTWQKIFPVHITNSRAFFASTWKSRTVTLFRNKMFMLDKILSKTTQNFWSRVKLVIIRFAQSFLSYDFKHFPKVPNVHIFIVQYDSKRFECKQICHKLYDHKTLHKTFWIAANTNSWIFLINVSC